MPHVRPSPCNGVAATRHTRASIMSRQVARQFRGPVAATRTTGTPRPMIELELRNDVYRRPLATALDRLGLREGWRCVDVGAGGGDVTVALARIVGRDG